MGYRSKKLQNLIANVQSYSSGYERLILIAHSVLKQTKDVFHDFAHSQRVAQIFNQLDLLTFRT